MGLDEISACTKKDGEGKDHGSVTKSGTINPVSKWGRHLVGRSWSAYCLWIDWERCKEFAGVNWELFLGSCFLRNLTMNSRIPLASPLRRRWVVILCLSSPTPAKWECDWSEMKRFSRIEGIVEAARQAPTHWVPQGILRLR